MKGGFHNNFGFPLAKDSEFHKRAFCPTTCQDIRHLESLPLKESGWLMMDTKKHPAAYQDHPERQCKEACARWWWQKHILCLGSRSWLRRWGMNLQVLMTSTMVLTSPPRQIAGAASRELVRMDPDVLLVSPPCGPFSIIQELNYPKMGQRRAVLMLAEGLSHLEFAMKLFQWQVMRGRLAIFEHPATSKGWDEPCVERSAQMHGVERVRADQYAYGLRVKDELNKKPTDFLVNGKSLAKHLSKRCSGQHVHEALMGGLALKAQHYPKALCKAMITGAEEDSAAWRQVWATEGENEEEEKELEDALDEEVEAAGAPVVRLGPPKEVGEDALGEAEEDVIEGGMSRENKKLVQKLHNNLGHPGRYEFCRALRMARARPEVWRYVKNEFRCGICDSQQKPKVARPGTVPRTFEAGHTVGVDVVFFPALEPRQNVPVLNITDWGTGYQSLEPLDSMSSEHVWMKFHQCWIRIFGVPQLAVMDQGREFVGSFSKKLAESGCLVKVIGARSPWQQGRTERHGGLAKETFIKVMEEILPSSKDEWKTCVYAVEAAKNRLYNRSGFSPAQRQLGCNLRLPGSLGSDDPCDPQLLVHSSSEDMRRSLQIRQSAMEAFLKQTATEVVQRSALARPRVSKSFEVGDIVYVVSSSTKEERRWSSSQSTSMGRPRNSADD